MSISSKVRVYELTRELDLETKDILAICEQLNIAVKSHSSTITETEADSIRAVAAEKSQEKRSSTTSAKAKESSKEAAKQQILAVSKPNVRLVTPPTVMSTETQTLSQPPKTNLTKPLPQSPEQFSPESSQPTINSPNSNSATLITTSTKPEKPSQLVQPPSRSNTDSASSLPSSDSTSDEVMSQSKEVEVVVNLNLETKPAIASKPNPSDIVTASDDPQVSETKKQEPVANTLTPNRDKKLVTPVTTNAVNKPAPPKVPLKQPIKSQPSNSSQVQDQKPEFKADKPADKAVQPQKAVIKPKLEKPKPTGNNNRPAPAAAEQVSPHTTSKRPQPVRPVPVKDSVLIERGITAPGEPSRPLRTPTAPLRPAEKPQVEKVAVVTPPVRKRDSTEAIATAPTAPPPILLERAGATPARANKRNKSKKEDEDQDVLELKEKAAKLHRPKRYLKVIEDEDIIDDLESTDISEVSLSLARPTARPKQRLTKPPAASPDLKSAGTTSKPGRRSSGRDRRNTQEVVIEKPTKLILQDSISVQELADQLMIPETDIIRTLFLKGLMVNINQTLDIPTASMVAIELGYEVEESEAAAPARKVTEMIEAGDFESLQRRPPVVTIMGHVDHGKTTLLDSIRKTKVAQGEAGGITQHIGAYHVDVEHAGQKQQIVFLDTPGHEAFTAMRARGARVTDVAILVVAADDGVQPQTIEAISHARAANVPIIVAINKVDKLEAQPDRIRQELTEYGLVDEEWGGDTIMVPVSAQRGDNLDTLLEMILLVTEVENLQANPDRSARGTVIEAHLDKARGPVATFLVQNGTLRVGDILVAGSAFGKVRAMVDDRGKRVDIASPSFAVEVLGLSDVPAAGDEFEVFMDEKLARGTASDRAMQQRHSRLQQSMSSRKVTLGTVSAKAQEGDLKELNLILKADVQGSVEAILGALGQLPQQEVQIRVLLAAAGEITENDVDLAAASDAVIIGFNTTMATGARQASDEMGVDVRDYNIIYKLLEDIQGAMEGLLEPELVEEPLGQAEVRALFTIGRGVVAGCYVLSGKLVRNCRVRIKRRNELIHEAALDSLKRMKEDVKEVAAGFECGMSLPKFHDWQEGDLIDAFRLVTKRRTLST